MSLKDVINELNQLDPRDPGRWPLAVRTGAIILCFVVLSACPQQWNPAANYHPSDLLARILTR